MVFGYLPKKREKTESSLHGFSRGKMKARNRLIINTIRSPHFVRRGKERKMSRPWKKINWLSPLPVQTCHHLNYLHIHTHFSFYYNRKCKALCFIMIKSVGNYLANLLPMQAEICLSHMQWVCLEPLEKNSFKNNHISRLLCSYTPSLVF